MQEGFDGGQSDISQHLDISIGFCLAFVSRVGTGQEGSWQGSWFGQGPHPGVADRAGPAVLGWDPLRAALQVVQSPL